MILIRPESPGDEKAIDAVNDDAFGRDAEARLVRVLRRVRALVLSLIAEQAGEIVGHISFSRARLVRGDVVVAAVALGPMAVRPAFQKQGTGSRLVRAGLDTLQGKGAGPVFVLGHATYYPRFGFEPAQLYGIRCQFDAPPEAFMVHAPGSDVLQDHSAAGGVFYYHPAFEDV